MAWNKSLSADATKAARGPFGLGAPVALNPAVRGRPYRDGWDIERAYREGVAKVTWVFRCIDVIAGNQARLPVMLRADNSPKGKIVEAKSNAVLDLLNTSSNMGENSFIFRYRLSAQLLMSTRGVFVEVVRGRSGEPIALHLLPPQSTAPIPDPKSFVAGYEVRFPGGETVTLAPENVLWLRRPHPLDPYLSLTPMEAAGVAIEIENLAKVYNRNYLLNDGRPGSLIVVRGEMDDDDKEELRSRFRGNLNKTGQTTVLAADDGVDFIDTSASPRDAAYAQMREITKIEILTAFGVPETIISQAGGRTFSNASEEVRVFWLETMLPHLEQIGRGLDALDDKHYVDFDTSQVPIFLVMGQEKANALREEFVNGLISGNEYRDGTGRSAIESDLMDSMLVNPNLTPIGNTEKPFEPPATPGAGAPPGAEAMASPAPGPEGLPGMPPAPAGPPPLEAPPGFPALPTPGGEAPQTQATAPGAAARASAVGLDAKSDLATATLDDWDAKADADTERWTQVLDRALERFFERQQRVVVEKVGGAKVRKALAGGTAVPVSAVFDREVWNRQMDEDVRPVLAAIVADAADLVATKAATTTETDDRNVEEFLAAQMARIKGANDSISDEVAATLLVAQAMRGGAAGDGRTDADPQSFMRTALGAVYADVLGKRQPVIAAHEAQTAYNAGTFFAGAQTEAATKTWVTRRDGRVRTAHRILSGSTIPVADGFAVDGAVLRFPGDPLAPPELTMNCRCRLRYRQAFTETAA